MKHLPFREVHVDFHTSEHIRDIGRDFDKRRFQQALRTGHVDAVTLFAKCHHGWLYYPSPRFPSHPHLSRNLLGEMLEACREIGVATQIYLSAGWDEAAARAHPEWRAQDKYPWPAVTEPPFTPLCFNTGYLDYLVEQVKEVLTLFPADGLSMDICIERLCVCEKCRADLKARGLDPDRDEEVAVLAKEVYRRYYTAINQAAKGIQPDIQIYHNGYVTRGRRDLIDANDYYQIEALPTGGWGYDLFPLTAAYASQFPRDMLAMTGKFHTHWGEFGGYKTANALLYETALALACGARCSIGDQMHPLGFPDEATYRLIGEAYARVKDREPWCTGAERIADVGLLSEEALSGAYNPPADVGANRLLLEGHYLYRVLDRESSFDGLKVILLPDTVRLDEALTARLRRFVQSGGRLLATGAAGVFQGEMAFDFGCRYRGESPYSPTYLELDFSPDFPSATVVVYGKRHRLEAAEDAVLGWGLDPYFNRTAEHYCSHQHAPADYASRSPGITEGKDGLYAGWELFSEYRNFGSITTKKAVLALLDRLLKGQKRLETDLPAQGIVTLTRQTEENRYVAHLLYASPVRRGGRIPASKNENIEVIEDILPIYDVSVTVRTPEPVTRVTLVPEGQELPFVRQGDSVSFTIPRLWCHTMVSLDYDSTEAGPGENGG